MVNQWQILSLLKRSDVSLTHVDAQLAGKHWQSEVGVFGADDMAKIFALTTPAGPFDVEYRISHPYDFRPSTTPVAAFCVTEDWSFPSYDFIGRLDDVKGSDTLRLVVPSSWARAAFISKGIDADRISVIPHGVDPGTHRFDEAAREAVRRQLGLNKFTFLNIGSLFGRKGIDRLLAAFLVLLERGTEATLLLKGSDNMYSSGNRLKNLLAKFTPAQRELIIGNLKYIGQPLEMAWMTRLFSAADAYVSPYIAEGFNMPVLEAAAAGLPLIVTGGGPTDDFTDDSFRKKIAADLDTSDGKMRLRPSVEHLVELMTAMVDDQEFAKRARTAGPAFVHNGYRWDDVADQLVGVFRTMV